MILDTLFLEQHIIRLWILRVCQQKCKSHRNELLIFDEKVYTTMDRHVSRHRIAIYRSQSHICTGTPRGQDRCCFCYFRLFILIIISHCTSFLKNLNVGTVDSVRGNNNTMSTFQWEFTSLRSRRFCHCKVS